VQQREWEISASSQTFLNFRILTYTYTRNIHRHVTCTCKLVFRQARFAAFIRNIQYIFHLLIRTGEDRVFPHREFELKPIDRRRDTNLGAPPIIYEPRHLSRHKPRDGGRIPAAFAFARFLCARETSKSDLPDYPENFGSPWPSEYLGDAPYPIIIGTSLHWSASRYNAKLESQFCYNHPNSRKPAKQINILEILIGNSLCHECKVDVIALNR